MKSLVVLLVALCYVQLQKIETEAQCCPDVVQVDSAAPCECGCQEAVPPPPPPPCPQPALPCAPIPPPRKGKLGKLKLKPLRRQGGSKPPTCKPMNDVISPAKSYKEYVASEPSCEQDTSEIPLILEDQPKMGGEPNLHFGPSVHVHGGTAIFKAMIYDKSKDKAGGSPYKIAVVKSGGGESC